jgi:phosphonate transport system substrate-binding protein
MKKKTLLAALLILALLTGCGQKPAEEAASAPDQAEEPTVETPLQLDTLAVELSRSGQTTQQLAAAVQELPDLLAAYFADAGVEVGAVTVTVGAAADTAQSLAAGNIDLAFLPAEALLVYGEGAFPLLADSDASGTAGTTAALSATDTAYGAQLAARVDNGPGLSWEELQNAKWGVVSEAADCLNLWLADNYEGNRLSDLDQVTEYETADALLADATELDILVRLVPVEDGLAGLAVTETLYQTLAAVTPNREELSDPRFQTALDQVLSRLAIEEPERMAVFGADHFAPVTDDQLDADRRWLTMNGEL